MLDHTNELSKAEDEKFKSTISVDLRGADYSDARSQLDEELCKIGIGKYFFVELIGVIEKSLTARLINVIAGHGSSIVSYDVENFVVTILARRDW